VLRHLSLHDVLDLWVEWVGKPRRQGEAYLMRYMDDFVGCFQSQADAQRFEQALVQRLAQFALALEPTQTRLVAFGRLAERAATRHGKRRETFTFLGLPLYGTRNHRGHCKVGWRTAKPHLRRRLAQCHQRLQIMRHAPLQDQAAPINQGLRGHYAYDGIAGNVGRLLGVYRHVERSWRARLRSRSPQGKVRWEVCVAIKRKEPLQRPQLSLPSTRLQQYAVLCIIV
jgi:RNA-directed DNA polymerase